MVEWMDWSHKADVQAGRRLVGEFPPPSHDVLGISGGLGPPAQQGIFRSLEVSFFEGQLHLNMSCSSGFQPKKMALRWGIKCSPWYAQNEIKGKIRRQLKEELELVSSSSLCKSSEVYKIQIPSLLDTRYWSRLFPMAVSKFQMGVLDGFRHLQLESPPDPLFFFAPPWVLLADRWNMFETLQ